MKYQKLSFMAELHKSLSGEQAPFQQSQHKNKKSNSHKAQFGNVDFGKVKTPESATGETKL